ncbi:MAG: hypothetical protein KGH53_02365 [Candidatus Micrarchaeota archaeon]|nr:hypothetical protein [Candidatus Micrarchaeota archaeon]
MPIFNTKNRNIMDLGHAGEHGNIAEIKRLIEVEKVPVDARLPNDPFHTHSSSQMAAARHQPETLELLLRTYHGDPFIKSRSKMSLDAIAWKHEDYKSAFVAWRAQAEMVYGHLRQKLL